MKHRNTPVNHLSSWRTTSSQHANMGECLLQSPSPDRSCSPLCSFTSFQGSSCWAIIFWLLIVRTQDSFHKSAKYDRLDECSPENDLLWWHWQTFRQPERKTSSKYYRQLCGDLKWNASSISTIRINKFFEIDFAIKVNASNERRFDRSTVIFKFGVRLKLHV